VEEKKRKDKEKKALIEREDVERERKV